MITLMDGDVFPELVRRGFRTDGPLANTARRMVLVEALMESPSLVRAVHDDYIGAGADVITMATESLTPWHLCQIGLESHLDDLLAAACNAACTAREAASRPVRVAACLGPLADDPRRGDSPITTLVGVYEYLLHMIATESDLILCVGIATVREAEAAALAGAMTFRPVWLSFAVDVGAPASLMGGEPLTAAVAAVDGLPIEGMLVQCAHADGPASRLPVLAPLTTAEFGCRLGLHHENLSADSKLSPDFGAPPSVETYGYQVEDWLDAGATIIGGGTGITPRHTSHIRSLIDLRPATRG